jgi:hypothetical protein
MALLRFSESLSGSRAIRPGFIRKGEEMVTVEKTVLYEAPGAKEAPSS